MLCISVLIFVYLKNVGMIVIALSNKNNGNINNN